MDAVVNFGVGMNFEPSPRRDLAARGAHLVGVKSWKAIFEGIGRVSVVLDWTKRTALRKGVTVKSGTKPN
jgi:hypothetical protein